MAFAYNNLEVDKMNRIYKLLLMLGLSGAAVRTGLEMAERLLPGSGSVSVRFNHCDKTPEKVY